MNKSVEPPRYIVREVDGRFSVDRYEICKFLDEPEPAELYYVEFNQSRGTIWCDCFGFRRMNGDKNQHKHIRLIREWIRRGKVDNEVFCLNGDEPVFVKNLLE